MGEGFLSFPFSPETPDTQARLFTSVVTLLRDKRDFTIERRDGNENVA